MIDGGAAYDVSQDVLLARVEALLEEWGEYQRREPAAWVAGYPGSSVEHRMAESWGRLRRPDKRRRWAHARKRRKVDMGKDAKGKDVTVSAVDMVPDRTDKQTEVRKTPAVAPWPEHIDALERLLARMPARLLKVACVYYIAGMSIRQAAATLKVSKDELGRRLERIRWFVAGQIAALDDGLSRQ